uniref:Phytochrome n=1 Tax=Coleochaete irregularis TaxID=187194 RepID=A0A059UFI8_COLIR|nr:phytochrome [Coleochaete irregularis]
MSSGGSGSNKSKYGAVVAQTSADAKLHAEFEHSQSSGGSFDYSKSLEAEKSTGESGDAHLVTAYLQRMQRGGEIQAFGCLICVEEKTFKVLAYSENAPDILEIPTQTVPGTPFVRLGTDVRTLLNPVSAGSLEKASLASDVNMLNPLTVHTFNTNKAFYAILHRIDVGLVIDLEPVRAMDPGVSAAGALQSHKLAAKAITRLQSLPGGDIGLLCDTVVEEVRELTGYDRVMAYKFHEDEHGEVVAEMRRNDLEPYLGLHYPATDVPQASRFLFMKNRVRIITDCNTPQVKIVQDINLRLSISLAGSTMRGVHGCHRQYMLNMGSTASLVMAVVINDGDDETTSGPSSTSSQTNRGKRLWGLVVCHHTTPRHVPFPLRSACEFLMQVFGLQLNMEIELAAQLREKHILRTQTLLCDMLLRDAPIGIVSQSPNIMDLVKCDGAALYYGGRFWLLGATPTEDQIKDIAEWLLKCHKDSTGLSTDSLAEAGYPNAESLGNLVCGMAAARITPRDFLFWFRSHTAKEVKWAGAKGDPKDQDDQRRMHPRSSFAAFLEVVRHRSFPWEDVEMDAIHSLQLILRGSFHDIEDAETKTMIHARMNELKLQGMDELSMVANEMVRLIETATAPILALDAGGLVNGWNAKVAELTGLPVAEAMGKSLVRDLITADSVVTATRLLSLALQGEEEQNVELKLKTWGDKATVGGMDEVILVVNACASRDGNDNIVGVCFVGQDVTGQKIVMDKFTRIQGDYETIVLNTTSLIPPIFGSDEAGFCCEWNPAMERLTGWRRDEAMHKSLVGDVFGARMGLCKLKGQDAVTKLLISINSAMDGSDCEKVPFAFYDRNDKYTECLLTVTKRTGAAGVITGAFCFIHTVSPELQHALAIQKAAEKVAESKAKEVAYLRQEIKNPLDGISFTRSFIEHTELSEDQRQLVETSAMCEKQLRRILEDADLHTIEEGCMELDASDFMLATVLNAVVSQGMVSSSRKGLQLFCDTPAEFKAIRVFGDQVRMQQVLADFLQNAIQFTPTGGWVEIKAIPDNTTPRAPGAAADVLNLEFRISHSGDGLPEGLLRQMFDRAEAKSKSQEGLGLSTCRKIVTLMHGEVEYVTEEQKGCFQLRFQLPLATRDDAGSSK